jgi:prepilin-type N-terminal cleavage/methylation domain-containing protein
MNRRGFTLIEVLIIIAIMGIIMAIAIPNYNDMHTKARIEKQTRELHSAIINGRITAMQNKQPRAMFLGPNQYIFKIYTSSNDAIPTAWKNVQTVNFQYQLMKKTSGATLSALDITSDKIQFDERGFTDNDMTLVVTPVRNDGGLGCIVVHTARTNIGRMDNASTCTMR